MRLSIAGLALFCIVWLSGCALSAKGQRADVQDSPNITVCTESAHPKVIRRVAVMNAAVDPSRYGIASNAIEPYRATPMRLLAEFRGMVKEQLIKNGFEVVDLAKNGRRDSQGGATAVSGPDAIIIYSGNMREGISIISAGQPGGHNLIFVVTDVMLTVVDPGTDACIVSVEHRYRQGREKTMQSAADDAVGSLVKFLKEGDRPEQSLQH